MPPCPTSSGPHGFHSESAGHIGSICPSERMRRASLSEAVWVPIESARSGLNNLLFDIGGETAVAEWRESDVRRRREGELSDYLSLSCEDYRLQRLWLWKLERPEQHGPIRVDINSRNYKFYIGHQVGNARDHNDVLMFELTVTRTGYEYGSLRFRARLLRNSLSLNR